MNEDVLVFPIENEDFPISHVIVFKGGPGMSMVLSKWIITPIKDYKGRLQVP